MDEGVPAAIAAASATFFAKKLRMRNNRHLACAVRGCYLLRLMSIRPYRNIARRKSRKIRVGQVEVGGHAPITLDGQLRAFTPMD